MSKKKIVSIVTVVLCLIICLTGCNTKKEEEVDIIGTWTLQSINMNGVTYTEKVYLEEFDYSFTFNEDGTAIVNIAGVNYNTTYSISNGRIAFDISELALIRLEVENDVLSLELNQSGIGASLVFIRVAN